MKTGARIPARSDAIWKALEGEADYALRCDDEITIATKIIVDNRKSET